MKKISAALFLVAVMLGATACTSSQEPEKKAAEAPVVQAPATVSPSQVETEITQLEKDWATAIVKKDTAALGNIIADDFNGTSPTASTFPKEDAIQEIKSGDYNVTSMDLDEISVNVYGDTAVAFTSQKEVSKYKGKDNSGHYHFTNVWVKRNGKWQVVASHGSRYNK